MLVPTRIEQLSPQGYTSMLTILTIVAANHAFDPRLQLRAPGSGKFCSFIKS